MNNKSITILFPIHGLVPRGGLKVAYEYANRLCRDGYNVHIVYPALPFMGKQSLISRIKYSLKFIVYRFFIGYSCRKWFPLYDNVQEHYLYSLDYKYVPKTDYYIATAVETAIFLNTYKIPDKNKLYLIQDFENWRFSDKIVKETYNFGFKNIVISNWLAEIVKETGADYTLIKNGFDFDCFKMDIPINKKNRFKVAMMFSTQQRKGCNYGFEALEIVKNNYPELSVSIFGVHPEPQQLPNYCTYYRNPNRECLNRIYNESAIFLAPSIKEGWGLPIGEAMICGCAVVCTENKGFREMAENRVTALMSPTRDSQSLAENIICLIEDDDLRKTIARRGCDNIKKFKWDDSYRLLKQLLGDDTP